VPFRIVLAGVALALCIAVAQSHDPSEIRQAAGAVAKDLGVQSRLPNSSGTEAPEIRNRDDGRGMGGDGISIPAPAAVFTLLQWVLIAVAAVAILALLAIVLRERLDPQSPRGVSGSSPEPDAPIPPTDPRALLARADELAAAGRYAEAMHCVLLAAMASIGGQPQKSADSLTSWELLRASALAPAQLQILRDLVTSVERAWFGKRPAEVNDYRFVRGRFDEFASIAPTVARGTA
jgi:hypothetical protein